MKHYICVLRDTYGHFIGPFETPGAACNWAQAHWDYDETKGDPRWRVLTLHDDCLYRGARGTITLPLHAPDQPGAVL